MTPRRLTGLILALAVVAAASLFPGEPPAHAQTGEITLWTGTLTAGSGTFDGTDATGYCTGSECSPGDFGSLSPATFTHTTVPYTVQKILVTASLGSLQLDQRLDLNVVTPLNLYVGTTAYPLAYAGSTGNLHLTGIPALTSGQSYEVSIRTTTEPPPPPPETVENQLWSATMTVGEATFPGATTKGFITPELGGGLGAISPQSFTYGGATRKVRQLYHHLPGGQCCQLRFEVNFEITSGSFVLRVGDDEHRFTAADGTGSPNSLFQFTTSNLNWTNGQMVTVSLAEIVPPPETITLWTATLVAGAGTLEGENAVGYCALASCLPRVYGTLSPDSFDYYGATYTVRVIANDELDILASTTTLLHDAAPFSLYVGDTEYTTTYTSASADINYDLSGNISLTSGQSYTVSIRTTAPPPPPPPETNEITLWTATLVAAAGTHEGADTAGYCASNLCNPNPFGSLTAATFTHADTQYGVRWILSGEDLFITGEPRLSDITLYLDSDSYPLTYNSGTQGYDVTGSITLTSGQSYTVSIRTTTTEPPPPPPETNEITLWTATLTAAAGSHEGVATAGYCASNLCNPNPFGSLTTTTFTHAGVQYGVRWILSGEDIFITGEPRLSDITLYLDSDSYPLTYNSGTQGYDVTGSIALTAGQTYAVSIRTTTTEPPPPPETSEGTLWTATLVAGAGPLEAIDATGYCTGGRCNEGIFGSLNPATFTHKGVQYSISKLLVRASGSSLLTLSPRLDQVTPFSLYVGDTEYPATFGSGGEEYDLTGTPTLTSGQTYTVSIRIPPPVLPPGTLWSATLTAGAGTLEGVNATGYCVLAVQCNPPFGTLSPDSFDYEGTTYSVNLIANDELYITSDLHEATPFSLFVGDTEYTATFTSPDADINYALSGNLSLTSGQTYTVSIRFSAARPGTLWRGSLTAAAGAYSSQAGVGYCGDLPVCAPRTFGALSEPTQFTYNAITYTVRALMSGGTGGGGGTLNLTGGNLQDQTLFVVYVGDAPYPISNRVGTRYNLGGGIPRPDRRPNL